MSSNDPGSAGSIITQSSNGRDRPASSATELANTLVEQAAKHAEQAIIAFDASGICMWINQAARHVLDIDDSVILEGKLSLLQHCLVSEGSKRAAIQPALEGQAVELTRFGYDLSSLIPGAKPGLKIFDSTRLLPMIGHDGGVARIYAFHSPVIERGKPTRWAGEAAQEILLFNGIDTAKRLVRRISHDFNNLISVVRGYNAVLQSQPHLDHESKQLTEMIERAGCDLAGLSDRLAGFADTGPRNQERISLNHIVRGFPGRESEGNPEGIEIQTDLGDSLPHVVGNEDQFRRTCWNIWQNALEAMPSG